jgi:primosomal protein N' (replication factor Y)
VVGLADRPADDVDPADLKELTKVSGRGPAADLLELADWAAWRWAGRSRQFLGAASPDRLVGGRGLPRRSGRVPGPTSPASTRLLGAGGGVLRLPPTSDLLPVVASAMVLGPTLVVAPSVEAVETLGARIRAAGATVASFPEDWSAADAGVDVVIGARRAAWAPCAGLAAAVVLDEHDEALQDEGSPTWHARDVLVERCRRAGVPVLLVSPAPTLTAVRWAADRGGVVAPPADRERAGWPILDVVDRTDELPWTRSVVTSELIRHLRDPDRRVVCVVNTTGRAKVVACRSCRELVRCPTCDAALGLDDEGRFRCGRCDYRRPGVCLACGAGAFANLRPGVTRLREELEAAANRPVGLVTGAEERLPDAPILVGTEAVLHRVGRPGHGGGVDVVAFLDADRELLAPRYRATEQMVALVIRAARLVGRRDGGGRVLVQTFVPDHPVWHALTLGDPGRLVAEELARRTVLGLPPVGALAEVAGPGAAEFLASLRGVEVGGDGERSLVRAPTWEQLADALAAGRRPPKLRLRVAVDPPRV